MGGAERQAELLCRKLARAGVAVTVLTFRWSADLPKFESGDGFDVIRLPYLRPLWANSKRPRRLKLAAALVQGIRLAATVSKLCPRVDVLHAINASTPYTAVAVRVARRRRIPSVVKVVNTGEWFDLTKLESESAFGPLARRWLASDVDRWIAISRRVAEELVEASIPPSRIVELPNGVETDVPCTEIPDLASRFLHVGRLSRTAPRDVRGLLRAFSALEVDDGHRPQLVVVGGGDRLEQLRSEASHLPSVERIRLVGEQESAPWRSWGHVLVQPSFAEGMSNALLEGMAAGLACVAYDIPPNREALDGGEAGELVPVGDESALAAALSRLATDRGRARRLGERARARAASAFSIDRVCERTISLYEELRG